MRTIEPDNSAAALQQALTELVTNSIETLRAQWRALFSAPPPPAFGPDLLRRSIAFKLQEHAYGARSAASQRDLDHLITTIEKARAGKIALPRRIKPGAVLIRDWKGKSHRVTVLEKGFTYADQTFASLSEIARAINPGQGGGHPGPGAGGPGHEPDTVTIIVNGRPKTVAKNAELSFWDIVKLAFDTPQTGDGIQYTIQFTRGSNNKPSGALVEGQTVKVKDGMEFDVTSTNRS